jgi:JmjC domain, hydroxylase
VHLTVDQIRDVCISLDVDDRDANPETLEEITVYVCEQQRGDLIITPARSWVQVSTYGEGDAASVSWMRFPLTSVDLALRFELPVLHR